MPDKHQGDCRANNPARLHARYIATDKIKAIEALSSSCPLSKSTLKQAMQCGAVWLIRAREKTRRIRKAQCLLAAGDIVELYYDRSILQSKVPEPTLLATTKEYSVWYKPAGMLAQGSRYGDHLSLLRHVEKVLNLHNRLHLIHRLDREACGIVIIAHSRHSAAYLSQQFANRTVGKKYFAHVCGHLQPEGRCFEINSALDGKPAHTSVCIGSYSKGRDMTEIHIDLGTGRYHQIRRHLQSIGHPLCGDRRYGPSTHSQKFSRLHLCAWQLTVRDPITRQPLCFTLEPQQMEFEHN